MRRCGRQPARINPVLVLAEIKAAVESFDHGDANVIDVMEKISAAMEAYRATLPSESCRDIA